MLKVVVAAVAIVAAAVAVGWAGGDGGASIAGIPLMVMCALLAFAIQFVAFVPAYLLRTERFYDLTGSLTYLTVTAMAILVADSFDPRSLLLAACIAVWALRLGLFLFRRVHQDGGDARFDELKQSAPRFLMAWTLQGLWVFLTLAAALAAITAGGGTPLTVLDAVGIGIWVAGFSLEVVADRQKRAFKRDPANKGRFISTGLWAWSRHPNYFGEIVLWVGIAVVAVSTLDGWRWITLVSPVFVILLLTRGSGVPILERRADERWGGESDYEAYKARTRQLILWPPRG